MDSQIKQYIEIFQSKKQIIENKQKEIDKLNDQFQKIIIPLNEDLVQSQEELNQFAQNIKFTLTLQELSQIISKATKTNLNQISSYINYAQTILSNNDDIFVKAPLTINYFIYNKKTRKSLFKGSYIANILDTQADGKTLYQHTILKINSKYEGWIHALGFFLFIAFISRHSHPSSNIRRNTEYGRRIIKFVYVMIYALPNGQIHADIAESRLGQ